MNYLAIEFQNLLRQPRVRVRQAPPIEPPARAGQNPGPRPPDQPPTPLIEESDIENSAEPHLSQVRSGMGIGPGFRRDWPTRPGIPGSGLGLS